MYKLTDQDKRVVEQTAKSLNMRLETFDDDNTDTLVDVNGSHTVDRTDDGMFLVCHVTVIPGVRYTSNGDGWPDDVDVTELSTHKNFTEAFASAVSLAAHQDVFNIADSVAEAADRSYLVDA
jgi:hypothetical protein